MTDGQQIALSIAPTVLPTLTVLVGILLSNRQIDALRISTDRQIDDLRGSMDDLRRSMDDLRRSIDHRFDAMEKLFTEKLRRVEEVMDARIRHLEERA